jgi:ATP-dependent Clp protease ATP-binding subunit ClpC
MFVQEPILITNNQDGVYVATSISESDFQSLAPTKSQAKRFLERKLAKALTNSKPFFKKIYKSVLVETRTFPVSPMHIERHRRYPSGEPLSIPIRVVKIIDSWDKLFGLLPDFDIHFYCPVEEDFGMMLQDAVRSVLSSISPEEIIQHWPPTECEVDWIRIHIPSKSNGVIAPRTRVLATVAESALKLKAPLIEKNCRAVELYQLRDIMHSGCGLLVGEAGVGKSTILKFATRHAIKQLRAEAKEAGSPIPNTNRFWFTSANRLIAGMRYLGQWQERLELVIAELGELGGVLVVDNLRDLVTLGGTSPSDSLAAFMLPYLRSGQLRIICESTPMQLDFCQRHLPAFIDLLPIVNVDPLSSSFEILLLQYVLEERAKALNMSVEPTLSPTIHRLSKHFLAGRPAPSGSIPFVEQWVSQIRDQQRRRLTKTGVKEIESIPQDLRFEDNNHAIKPLTKDMMLHAFTQWTGLPRDILEDSVLLRRNEVTEALEHEVIGQPRACNAVTDIVMRLKATMHEPGRPLGCLLFCGPTGVGKTQLAKSLAKYLFGADKSRSKLIRLDMSEFQSYAAGHRLLRDAEGKSAAWIQSLREQPLQVLLLDEIEKASSEVFDVLLSVLDEGRLSDSVGNVTSLRSTVIILTSNLGSTQNSLSGFHGGSSMDYGSYVRKVLRPEFINRLDGIVAFESLSPETVLSMTRKELSEINQREGVQRQGFRLEFTQGLVAHVAKAGFSPTLGARPLQRTIESMVMAPLSRWMIDRQQVGANADSPSDCRILLDWKDDLVFIDAAPLPDRLVQ